MYEATLQPVSNRADWLGTLEMLDDDTGEAITDLTGVSLVIEVRARGAHHPILSATTDNGKVTDAGNGVFEWHFDRAEMSAVCPGSYEIGITMSRDDLTDQELIGIVPIVDGIVSR